MPCPKSTYAESHIEGEMRKRAMKGQSNGFIYFFLSGRKQKLQSFCCVVTMGMLLMLWARKPLKAR